MPEQVMRGAMTRKRNRWLVEAAPIVHAETWWDVLDQLVPAMMLVVSVSGAIVFAMVSM